METGNSYLIRWKASMRRMSVNQAIDAAKADHESTWEKIVARMRERQGVKPFQPPER